MTKNNVVIEGRFGGPVKRKGPHDDEPAIFFELICESRIGRTVHNISLSCCAFGDEWEPLLSKSDRECRIAGHLGYWLGSTVVIAEYIEFKPAN